MVIHPPAPTLSTPSTRLLENDESSLPTQNSCLALMKNVDTLWLTVSGYDSPIRVSGQMSQYGAFFSLLLAWNREDGGDSQTHEKKDDVTGQFLFEGMAKHKDHWLAS